MIIVTTTVSVSEHVHVCIFSFFFYSARATKQQQNTQNIKLLYQIKRELSIFYQINVLVLYYTCIYEYILLSISMVTVNTFHEYTFFRTDFIEMLRTF